MDPIGPGNYDRAWNDPPKFAYNAGGQGGAGGRRRLLNKRVPVPIGPPNTAPTSTAQPILKAGDPPPITGPSPLRPPTIPLSHPPQSPPSVQACERAGEAAGKSSEEMLEEVEAAVAAALVRATPSLKDSVREEVSRRLGVMRDMWVQGQLSPPVHHRITTLATALVSGDYDRAWGLHQGLIVDYTSLCSPWMLGLKTLIAECRAQASTRAVQEEKAEEAGEKEEDVAQSVEGEETKAGDEGGEDSTTGVDVGVEALAITEHQQPGHTEQTQDQEASQSS